MIEDQRKAEAEAMTDAEVICGWMEPKPEYPPIDNSRPLFTVGLWWEAGYRPHREWYRWYPVPLTLDRLHEVEARLTEEQWVAYMDHFWEQWNDSGEAARTCRHPRFLLHASAEQKTKALAAVLRGEG